jgi:glycosyltransferase involved in cell wall biosynthesis
LPPIAKPEQIDMGDTYRGHRLAVVLPCYNEATAIASVVSAFRTALPEATIHVFDNASTDGSAELARAAGAKVLVVRDRGKGNVVRRMFADVEADIYVMADADGTYEAAEARAMVDAMIAGSLDMVVGTRRPEGDGEIYRFGHRFGNSVLTGTVAWIFGHGFTDMLSGYRAFSRRYVKSFPALSRGFEIETELTIHALELRAPYMEMPTAYLARAEGSESKLSTWRDGARIVKTILRLYMRERPRQLYLLLAALLTLVSLGLGIPVIAEYLETGLVPRLPTAVMAASCMLAALLSGVCALILDSVVTGRSEAKRLRYLAIEAVRVLD